MRRKYASPNRKFNNTVLKIGNFDCKGTVLDFGRMGCFIYLASGNQKNRPFGYTVKVGTADEAFQVKIVLSLRHNTISFATKLPLYKAAPKDTIFR